MRRLTMLLACVGAFGLLTAEECDTPSEQVATPARTEQGPSRLRVEDPLQQVSAVAGTSWWISIVCDTKTGDRLYLVRGDHTDNVVFVESGCKRKP